MLTHAYYHGAQLTELRRPVPQILLPCHHLCHYTVYWEPGSHITMWEPFAEWVRWGKGCHNFKPRRAPAPAVSGLVAERCDLKGALSVSAARAVSAGRALKSCWEQPGFWLLTPNMYVAGSYQVSLVWTHCKGNGHERHAGVLILKI